MAPPVIPTIQPTQEQNLDLDTGAIRVREVTPAVAGGVLPKRILATLLPSIPTNGELIFPIAASELAGVEELVVILDAPPPPSPQSPGVTVNIERETMNGGQFRNIGSVSTGGSPSFAKAITVIDFPLRVRVKVGFFDPPSPANVSLIVVAKTATTTPLL